MKTEERKLLPMQVPANWTWKDDRAVYDRRWGKPEQIYIVDLLSQLTRSDAEFLNAICHALEVIPIFKSLYGHALLTAMNAEERLDLLMGSAIVMPDGPLKERLTDAVETCQWVERARRRVLWAADEKGNNTLMVPIMSVCEHLHWAADLLKRAVERYQVANGVRGNAGAAASKGRTKGRKRKSGHGKVDAATPANRLPAIQGKAKRILNQ